MTSEKTAKAGPINMPGDATLAELAQADQVIAALGDAFVPLTERRAAPRQRHQVQALLNLPDTSVPQTYTLHTRDLDAHGSGFVTTQPLSESARGTLALPSPDGTTRQIPCRVRRSRQVKEGWYEGTVEFETIQPIFSAKRIRL